MKGAMGEVEADVGDEQSLDRLQPHRLRLDGGGERLGNKTLRQQHRRANHQYYAGLDDNAVEEQVENVVQPMPARRRLLAMQRQELLQRDEDEGR
ncbi:MULTISPECIES: hypothetical protein [unclassified Mesorhizobium]|uniref:hypothetical protein n=1 Tax=unclassified Mesorhizobium TaxID=325217 RepID=UPI001FE16FDE|nr:MULTISPECIES: hypothetical protein [unclassified Mesorhizobium]